MPLTRLYRALPFAAVLCVARLKVWWRRRHA